MITYYGVIVHSLITPDHEVHIHLKCKKISDDVYKRRQSHNIIIYDLIISLTTVWLNILHKMDFIYYSFAPLILFRVPYTLDLLP